MKQVKIYFSAQEIHKRVEDVLSQGEDEGAFDYISRLEKWRDYTMSVSDFGPLHIYPGEGSYLCHEKLEGREKFVWQDDVIRNLMFVRKHVTCDECREFCVWLIRSYPVEVRAYEIIGKDVGRAVDDASEETWIYDPEVLASIAMGLHSLGDERRKFYGP